MRSVLSISIPPKKLAALKKRAKCEGMTISAYVLSFVDQGEDLITEAELLEDIRQGERDLAQGKYRILGPGDALEEFFPIKK